MQRLTAEGQREVQRCLDEIGSFPDPAFSYVLKWPDPDWRMRERALFAIWDAVGVDWSVQLADLCKGRLLIAGYGDSPEEQMARGALGPQPGYAHNLAVMAADALTEIFGTDGRTGYPRVNSFVQVEIGKRVLHVHLVVGGPGVSKFNAKLLVKTIGERFFGRVTKEIRGIYMNSIEDLPRDISEILKSCQTAMTACNAGKTAAYSSVLQYRSRRGDTHALRVDAKEFIKDYLLPKNRRWATWMQPDWCTHIGDWFPGTDKTYAASLLNGRPILDGIRFVLHSELERTFMSNEPVLRGSVGPWNELPKVGPIQWQEGKERTGLTNKVNKRESLVLGLVQQCEERLLVTYEDLVTGAPELLIMLESQPGGNRLLQQALEILHIKLTRQFTAMKFIQRRYQNVSLSTDNKLVQLFNLQGYNPLQAAHWLCCVLNHTSGKQNSVNFYGPASTGKTNAAKAIVQACLIYGNVNHQNRNFTFNDCRAKFVLWWEECLMHNDYVESAKCVMGGTDVRIDIKNRDSMCLSRTPVILSTNHNIYQVVGGNTVTHVHEAPLKERVVQFNFMKMLDQNFGEIEPREVAELLLWAWNEYDCTLGGYLERWQGGKGRVPNSFPLAQVCPGHSQDFIYHDNGLCMHCGAYQPPSTDPEQHLSADEGERIRDTLMSQPLSADDVDRYLMCFCSSPDEAEPEAGPSRRKRGVDETDGEPEAPDRPAKTARAISPTAQLVSEAIQRLEEWASQPGDSHERREYERTWAELEELVRPWAEAEPEPVAGPSGAGAEAGELPRAPYPSPNTTARALQSFDLYCFEAALEGELPEERAAREDDAV